MVEVEEAGIEGVLGEGLYRFEELAQERGPSAGLFGGAGVSVGEVLIGDPGDLAGGDDGFSEEAHGIGGPRDLVEERIEKGGGGVWGKDGAEVEGAAVAGEEVARGGGHGGVGEGVGRRKTRFQSRGGGGSSGLQSGPWGD
ncbi:MAG: hypothetical protein RLZZ142_1124 [Verrucomicrobiota bacterium]